MRAADMLSARQTESVIRMVRKETCPTCKGGRYVSVKTSAGTAIWKKCPDCGGHGYKVRIAKV